MNKMISIDYEFEEIVSQLERIGGLMFCLQQTGLLDQCFVDSGYAENVSNSEVRFTKLVSAFNEVRSNAEAFVKYSKVKALHSELTFIKNEFRYMLDTLSSPDKEPSKTLVMFERGIDGVFVLLFDVEIELKDLLVASKNDLSTVA